MKTQIVGQNEEHFFGSERQELRHDEDSAKKRLLVKAASLILIGQFVKLLQRQAPMCTSIVVGALVVVQGLV